MCRFLEFSQFATECNFYLNSRLRFCYGGSSTPVIPKVATALGIHDPIGLSYLAQRRVGLSRLNFQEFMHDFRDTVSPMCLTNDGIEDM